MDGSVAADLPSVPRRTWVQLRDGIHVHLSEAGERCPVVTSDGLSLLARLGVPIAFLDPADGSLCWGNDCFSRLCGRAGVVTDWGALRPSAGPMLDILEYVRANNLRVDVQAPVRLLLPGLLSLEAAEQGNDVARLHCQAVQMIGEQTEGVGSEALPYNRDLLSLQFPTFRVPGQREEEEGGASGFVQTGAGQVVALIDAAIAYRSDARDKLKDLRRRVLDNRLDEPVDAPDLLDEVGLSEWRDSASLAVMLGADFSDRRRSIALPRPSSDRRRTSTDHRRRSVSTAFRP